MEAATVPGPYNLQILQNAEEPPSRERQLPRPVLTRCTLVQQIFHNQEGGDPEEHEMIIETGSGRKWLFERRIRKAIYGEVWRAVEVEIIDNQYIEQHDEEGRTRKVAVKRMPWEKINRLRGRRAEDPMKEIAALAVVSNPGHANVLRQEAALDDGMVVYLVTRFVDGGELFDWIAEDGGAYRNGSTENVRHLFRQLVRGMQYSHSKGICHADMSLENALVDKARENAFIIDYGMSLLMPIDREYRRLKSVPDRRMAKASYCCPETYKNSAYDGVKVDVFAAGAMLFMMLTGSRTFVAATRVDRRFRQLVWRGEVEGVIQRDGLRLVGDQAADSRQAVDLIRRMMAYRPEDRLLPEQVSWYDNRGNFNNGYSYYCHLRRTP